MFQTQEVPPVSVAFNVAHPVYSTFLAKPLRTYFVKFCHFINIYPISLYVEAAKFGPSDEKGRNFGPRAKLRLGLPPILIYT